MGLSVIDYFSDSGGGPGSVNEDIAGHGACAAWVLDGATGLTENRILAGSSDAAALVSLYDSLFRAWADDRQIDTRELVAGAIEEAEKVLRSVNGNMEIARHELPSAGMVLARLRHQVLEIASLGDCRAILELPDRHILTTRESPLSGFDAEVLAKMAALRRTNQADTHAEARRAVDGDLRRNRAKLNTADGYWVLSIHKEAADRMQTVAVPLAPGETVTGLLVTDGLYRLVDTFGEMDEAKLLAQARQLGLRPLLDHLRELENADSDCTRPVRFKQKDDATGLLFQIRAA